MKKIVALLLTAVMVLGCVPGLAENTKHERVYVVTAADGTIKASQTVFVWKTPMGWTRSWIKPS